MYKSENFYFLALFFLLFITACQEEQGVEKASIFSAENLPKSIFEFSSDQDTILIAEGGTMFHIPANAFVDENNAVYKGIVTIELLEALTLEDMVLGNLTTVAKDGRLLESSGMFRLQIQGNGKTLKVNPASKVMMTIPSMQLRDSAQIFYGNMDEQGQLIWSVAETSATQKSNERLLLGRKLLLKECSSCHNINLVQDMTGPALAWVTKRWKSMDDLIAFTKNSEALAKSGNLRAKLMVNWDASTMLAFEHLSDEEIKAIYYYIDEIGQIIDSTEIDPVDVVGEQRFLDNSDTIIRRMNTFYQVSSILNQSFKWVNIDSYLRSDLPKQKKLDIKIDVNKDEVEFFYIKDVKIIFPSRNTIVSAYPSLEENYYSFTELYKLKSTPFPIGDKAYLMATFVSEQELYFGLKAITIGDKEVEELDLKAITKEALYEQIKETF